MTEPEHHSVNIQIVEDDPGVADALVTLLEGMGHHAHVHADAEAFFEGTPPKGDDVVIVDLSLPGIGGAQVIRWLHSMAAPPRVIAISGQPQTTIDRALRDVPVTRLLRKPLSPDVLSAAL